MGIDVVMETEDGEPEDRLMDSMGYFARVLGLPGLENTICLRFIDPYGDTVFNQLQIPQLISELEALRGRVTHDELRALAVQQLEVVRRAEFSEGVIREYEAAIERVTAKPARDHLEAVLLLARRLKVKYTRI